MIVIEHEDSLDRQIFMLEYWVATELRGVAL